MRIPGRRIEATASFAHRVSMSIWVRINQNQFTKRRAAANQYPSIVLELLVAAEEHKASNLGQPQARNYYRWGQILALKKALSQRGVVPKCPQLHLAKLYRNAQSQSTEICAGMEFHAECHYEETACRDLAQFSAND